MLLSKCVAWDIKKSKFTKEQELWRWLSKLAGTKMPNISDLPIINTLF